MRKKYVTPAIIIFSIIEIILLGFVLFGISPYRRYCSYGTVCLSFAFSLCFISYKNKNYLIQFALFFTIIADFYLVLLKSDEKLIAMISFSIAQIFYAAEIHKKTIKEKPRKIFLYFRIFAILIAEFLCFVVLKNKVDFLSLISLFYFANLLITTAQAFYNFKHSKLFAIGLLLFILCDIVIGLQGLFTMYFDLNSNLLIYKIIFSRYNLAWHFYVPSQTLIAITAAVQLKKK